MRSRGKVARFRLAPAPALVVIFHVAMKKKTPASIRFVLLVLSLCIFGALGNAARALSYDQSIVPGDTASSSLAIAYFFLAAAASYLVVALTGRHKSARALTITYFVVAFFMFALLSSSGEEIGLFPSPASLDANGLVVRGIFPLVRIISFVASIVCLVGSSGAKRYLAAPEA